MENITGQDLKPNWYTKGRSKLSQLFSNNNKEGDDKTTDESVETVQEKTIKKDQAEQNKFIEEFKSQTSLNVEPDKLSITINNYLAYETKLFEVQGYNDGIKGVKDKNIASSAETRSNFIFEHTNAILSGSIKGLADEKKLKTLQLSDLTKELEDEKDFNDEINFLNKKEHRNFSRPIALFYIIVGISLMFADFPISLGIAKYFIDLPVLFDETFRNKVSNPEIVLFSLGITFLSVYYKILYDEYINVSIISKKIKGSDVDNEKTIQDQILFYVRIIIKLSIFILLLVLLYNIGNVRNAMNEVPVKSPNPEFVTDAKIFNYKLISFIGTTILLPLLSGICLSIGFSTLSNLNNLKTSDTKLKRLQTDKQELDIKKTKIEKEEGMLHSLKEEWEKGKIKIEGLKLLFVNTYDQGYKRGHRTQFGYDIYENAHSMYVDYLNSQN